MNSPALKLLADLDSVISAFEEQLGNGLPLTRPQAVQAIVEIRRHLRLFETIGKHLENRVDNLTPADWEGPIQGSAGGQLLIYTAARTVWDDKDNGRRFLMARRPDLFQLVSSAAATLEASPAFLEELRPYLHLEFQRKFRTPTKKDHR